MKLGILISARLGSIRLKEKHFLEVNGQPVLHYLIARIAREFGCEIQSGSASVIIATTEESENKRFEVFQEAGTSTFYGSRTNIPRRHLQAAERHSLDGIVAVDGDDILCSVRAMRCVYEALCSSREYVRTVGLPLGMNCFGYSEAFLKRSVTADQSGTLETGWARIFDEAAVTEIRMSLPECGNSLRFTMDYEEDYQFFSDVIGALGEEIYEASDEQIVNTVIDGKLFEANESVATEYWENFRRNMDEERLSS
ncbi:cytidylyltransferase domain-containing protein [Planctomycetota bacterium]